MSGFLQKYAIGLVYVNGSLLAEESQMSISRSSSSSPVMTLHAGYAGSHPGAEILDIQVTSNFPSTYLEFDPGQFIYGARSVEFDCVMGGQVMSFFGQVISDNFSHAVNSNSQIQFTARGRFTPIQGFWRAS